MQTLKLAFSFVVVLLSGCNPRQNQAQEPIHYKPLPQVVVEPPPSKQPTEVKPLHLEEVGALGVKVGSDRKLIAADHTQSEVLALNVFNEVAMSLQFIGGPDESGELTIQIIQNPINHYLPSCDLTTKTCPDTGTWIASHKNFYVEVLTATMQSEGILIFGTDESFRVFYEPINPREKQLLLCGQRQKKGFFADAEDVLIQIQTANLQPSSTRICRFIPWYEASGSFAADLYQGWRLRMAIIGYF